ncbi:nuclear transport factor 2 family protein [Paraburkholderia edwinii]|uniref:Nuclear transport factor 2 family protein n=1 Tax=Paraburkholderia edwinii TaxID=2861782 RepID=A0ABX8UJL0_9BURK|nr:nuclear transport factor 2 family protein [Paraburkholderia edwinii]QYD67210.1 nuclear transport factor 2 family protein [Paraburkholderia edwinii]
MKKLLMVLGVGLTAGLTAGLASSGAWASSADETAVNDAMNRLSAAMIAGDAQQMKALTADTLTYGHSSGKVQNQAEFIDTIASGQTRYKRIDLTKTVTTVSGNDAVIRDHFNGTTDSGGKLTDVDFDVLTVWQKQREGDWKLLARQGYKH